MSKNYLTDLNYEVKEASDGASAIRQMEEDPAEVVLLDVKLPDINGTELLRKFRQQWSEVPVIMITAYGVIDDAVRAMREGAYDFFTKPIDYTRLMGTLKNAIEAASLKKEIAYYREKEEKSFGISQIVAVSSQMRNILKMVRKIAESETSIVLLSGESGTGKDLLAQAIHQMSRRRNGSYVVINCSAIPENLLESELFGYEKGAFTDARNEKKD